MSSSEWEELEKYVCQHSMKFSPQLTSVTVLPLSSKSTQCSFSPKIFDKHSARLLITSEYNNKRLLSNNLSGLEDKTKKCKTWIRIENLLLLQITCSAHKFLGTGKRVWFYDIQNTATPCSTPRVF